jgi:TRAP-type transport system periplasmic protein
MQIVKLAGYQGPNSILTKAMGDLAKQLEGSAFGAQLHTEVNVTSNGETAQSLFDSVASGDRQICYMASGYLAAKVSELNVLDLAFSVSDRRQALVNLDSRAGDLISAAVHRQSNFKVLGFWDNGFRHVSNGVRPIRTLQDCKGLKVRTLDSLVYRQQLDALGFISMTSDVKELVNVVRTKVVDAQENPLTNFENFSLWQHHPYLSLTGHFFGIALLVCSQRWFDSLFPAQKTALMAAARVATLAQRIYAENEDKVCLQALQARGTNVEKLTAATIVQMKSALEGVQDSILANVPRELLLAYLQH